MKLKINKACDLASISVLPPRRNLRSSSGSRGIGSGMSAAAEAPPQMKRRSQAASQQLFSPGGSSSASVAAVSQQQQQLFSQGGSGFSASAVAAAVASQQLFSPGGSASASAAVASQHLFSPGGSESASAAAASQQQLFSQGTGASVSRGRSGFSASAVAAAVASQQQRSQEMSQQLFSQGGGASGSAAAAAAQQQMSLTVSQPSFSQGGAPILHSQLSQAIEEDLLDLRSRHQRFGLHDDSSKRIPSGGKDESQLQLAKISGNPIHRWNKSLPDDQVPNEDVERKFQHLASSVHKMGMVLDSVQNDVMQLNRAMKEASLDSAGISQKIVLLENSLQKILKGQDDFKTILEGSTKCNTDQMSILNSHSKKLDEVSSVLSVWPKQVQEDIRSLQGAIPRIFAEMEAILRAIKTLKCRSAAMQVVPDQCCSSNPRPQTNRRPIANGRPQMNRTPVANGRHHMNRAPVANGRPQMNQKPAENGRPLLNQVQIPKLLPAPYVNQRKVADEKPTVGPKNAKAAPQKMAGWVAPKKSRMVNPQVPTKKEPVSVLISSDDDDDERSPCFLLKAAEPAALMSHLTEEEPTSEDVLEILRRARKRRMKEDRTIVMA